jgi:hypothetical protein
MVVTGMPFIIVYRIEPAFLLILPMLHGSQRWP